MASTPPAALAEVFDAELTEVLRVSPPAARFNVAPTADVVAVATSPATGVRRLGTFRWGLVPPWAHDPRGGASMINARAETVADKPAFRDALLHHRCIVPADGFYEWCRSPDGSKQPYLIRHRDGTPLALAGLWALWRGDAEPLRTCTVITTTANAVVAPLHDRMPVVLPPAAWGVWLDPTVHDVAALLALLAPAPAAEFEAFPVSRAVNDARRDDPGLVAPVVA